MIPAFDPQTLNAYYAQLHAALPQRWDVPWPASSTTFW